jgi:hypothetical protein
MQAGRVKLSLLASMTYFWALIMGALCSSELSINFYETTRYHTPESTVHGHSCKNLFFVGFERSPGLQSGPEMSLHTAGEMLKLVLYINAICINQ